MQVASVPPLNFLGSAGMSVRNIETQLKVAVVLGYAIWLSAPGYEPAALDQQVEQALARHASSTDRP